MKLAVRVGVRCTMERIICIVELGKLSWRLYRGRLCI